MVLSKFLLSQSIFFRKWVKPPSGHSVGDVGTAFSGLGAGLSVNNCEVVAQMGGWCSRNHWPFSLGLLTHEENKTWRWCGISHRWEESALGFWTPVAKALVLSTSPFFWYGDQVKLLGSSHLLGPFHSPDMSSPWIWQHPNPKIAQVFSLGMFATNKDETCSRSVIHMSQWKRDEHSWNEWKLSLRVWHVLSRPAWWIVSCPELLI